MSRNLASSRFFVLGFTLLSVAIFSGCGPSSDLIEVKGKVTLNGNPLETESGTITFHPTVEGGKTPLGLIEADGVYTLYTEKQLGAPAGTYKVTIVAQASPSSEEAATDLDAAGPTYLVPNAYMDENQTPLTVEVVAGGNFDLDVKK